MEFVTCWDDDQETDHAFNVYLCEMCGNILKHDVAEGAGKIWIDIFNTVTRVYKEGE